MAALRKRKSQKSQKKQTENKLPPKQQQQQKHKVGGSSKLGKLSGGILVLVVTLLYTRYRNKTSQGSSSSASADLMSSQFASWPPAEYRTFLSGPGIQVYVVKDFLPPALAQKWRDTMRHEWNRHANNDASSWRFATNNNGSDKVSLKVPNNQKTRSLEKIAERNRIAQLLDQHNQFAYSKWELLPSHELVQEIEHVMASPEMMARVEEVVKRDSFSSTPTKFQPELSDLFVTYYGTRDFLNTHNDGSAGTWAFVVSLMDGPQTIINNTTTTMTAQQTWQEDFGGQTRYECPYPLAEFRQRYMLQMQRKYQEAWCESIFPSFNTALLFRTRPVGPQHNVYPVSHKAQDAGFYRFGFTGWYMSVDDTLSERSRVERDKMRARD